MKNCASAIVAGLVTGKIAGIATAVAASACGARDSGSAIAPINAVSHIAWGDEAAEQEDISAKYTLAGLALNSAACVSWAVLYEKFFGDAADEGDIAKALLGGAVISGVAYVTDYHIVPKRLTPGFEKRLSCNSLAVVYTVLALGLGLGSLARKKVL